MNGRVFISIDDTDVVGGEGTGRLARRIVDELGLEVEGVTRHQLFVHPSINYTKRNSCNVIIARAGANVGEAVRNIILESFQEGSDPGLAIASSVPHQVRIFGRKAQREVLGKQDAIRIAKEAGIQLEELGGTGDGIIGALAGIGLCYSGEDGRYVMLRGMRDLRKTVSVERLREIGINAINVEDGRNLENGKVILSDRIRPSRLAGRPILFVEECENAHYPIVL